MSVPEVLEFLMIPAIGWLMLNSYANQKRLTRIETMLEMMTYNEHQKNYER